MAVSPDQVPPSRRTRDRSSSVGLLRMMDMGIEPSPTPLFAIFDLTDNAAAKFPEQEFWVQLATQSVKIIPLGKKRVQRIAPSNFDHEAWLEMGILESAALPDRAITLRIAHNPRSAGDIVASLMGMAMHPKCRARVLDQR